MSLNKRFTGDYKLESIDSGDKFLMNTAGGVTIDTTTATPIIFATALVTDIRYRIIFQGTTDFTTVGAVEFTAGSFEIGDEYVITAVDDGIGGAVTDFTSIGATDNDVGTMFTATGAGAGTGTAVDTLFVATGVGIGTGTAKAAQGVTITGDLTVLGTSTSIKSTDTDIVDNTIVLNSGEIGPGVSAGVSGIEIDRGDGASAGHQHAGIRFSEALGGANDGGWEVNNGDMAWTPIVTGTGFELITDLSPQLGADLDVNGFDIVSLAAADINLLSGGAITVESDGLATLESTAGNLAVTALAGSITINGDTSVTISSPGPFTANVGGNATLQSSADITVSSGNNTTISGANVILTAIGGLLKAEQEISIYEQTIPILADGIALYNKLSAGVAGEGGTGLYFVNDTVTDELVSKKKAIAYSIIF